MNLRPLRRQVREVRVRGRLLARAYRIWRREEEEDRTRRLREAREAGLSTTVDPPFLSLAWSMLLISGALTFYCAQYLYSNPYNPSLGEEAETARQFPWVLACMGGIIFTVSTTAFCLKLLRDYAREKYDHGYNAFWRSALITVLLCLAALIIFVVRAGRQISQGAV